MRSLRLPLFSALLLVLAFLPGRWVRAQDQAGPGTVIAALVHPSSFPRILVWLPKESRVVEQALSETIIHQALARGDVYYKVVDNADAFEGSARSGIFNACILFEPQETTLRTALLKDLVRHGQGIAVIGAGATARAAAEQLGFSLDEALPRKTPDRMVFSSNPGMNLSGSVPISGKALFPRKKGSLTVASYQNPNRPAALLDLSGRSRLLVMPFSLTGSAYRAGASDPYSQLLRAAALAVVPDKEEWGGPEAEAISVASPSGPVNTRIKVTLNPGSQVLWANAGGRIEGNTVSFQVQADQLPRNLYYLYLPKSAAQAAPSAEIFVEQNGAYRSQGAIR